MMRAPAFACERGREATPASQRHLLRVRKQPLRPADTTLAAGIGRGPAPPALFYLVANIYPHNAKLRTFEDDGAGDRAAARRALIMADPWLILMVRERWPEVPIHPSVQANTTNYAPQCFWSGGVKRIILSRELSLGRGRRDPQRLPRHGAGSLRAWCAVHRLLRALPAVGCFNHRDPSQGGCTNPAAGTTSCRTGRRGRRRRRAGLRRRLSTRRTPARWAPPRAARSTPRRAWRSAAVTPPRRQQGVAAGRRHPPGRADADRGGRARHLHPQLRRTCARSSTCSLVEIGVDCSRSRPHQSPTVACAAQGLPARDRRCGGWAALSDVRLLGELEEPGQPRLHPTVFHQRHSRPSSRTTCAAILNWAQPAGMRWSLMPARSGRGRGQERISASRPIEFVQPGGNTEAVLSGCSAPMARQSSAGQRLCVWLALLADADRRDSCFIAALSVKRPPPAGRGRVSPSRWLPTGCASEISI